MAMLSLSGLMAGLLWFLTRPIVIALGMLMRVSWLVSWLLHRKPKPFTFRPPKNNRLIIRLAQWLFPLISSLWWKIEGIEVDADGLQRLRQFKGKRVILCPNHPTGIDPAIVFYLSNMLEDDFNYLAAKECFENPIKGWFMQRLGCYSIVRGTADTESFRMTRQLLVDGKRWLVICPEGETCGQNDTVMPFQQGVAQIAFWALEDLSGGKQQFSQLPPLYLLPVAIKYTYTRDMRKGIARSLARLERKLGLPSPTLDLHPFALYERLRRVGETVLTVAEREYGVRPPKDATLNDRVQKMKELIVNRVAAALGITFRPDQPLMDRVRALFNAIDRIVYDEPKGSEYERQLHQQRQGEVEALYEDLWRVWRFIATYDGYVREAMTAERFLEVVGRLEWEVFGKEWTSGPRKALVTIGEPINLTDHWADYQHNKRATVAALTAELERRVKMLLADLNRRTHRPLVEVA